MLKYRVHSGPLFLSHKTCQVATVVMAIGNHPAGFKPI